jgi:hypothetical protein
MKHVDNRLIKKLTCHQGRFIDFPKKVKSRLGAPKAITAIACKLAIIVYSMLKHGTEYFVNTQRLS